MAETLTNASKVTQRWGSGNLEGPCHRWVLGACLGGSLRGMNHTKDPKQRHPSRPHLAIPSASFLSRNVLTIPGGSNAKDPLLFQELLL
jgi:hypothetical protein